MTPFHDRAYAIIQSGRLLNAVGLFDAAAAQAVTLREDLLVSQARAGRTSRRGNIVRGADKGRIIFSETAAGVRRELHATKGWRTRRVSAS